MWTSHLTPALMRMVLLRMKLSEVAAIKGRRSASIHQLALCSTTIITQKYILRNPGPTYVPIFASPSVSTLDLSLADLLCIWLVQFRLSYCITYLSDRTFPWNDTFRTCSLFYICKFSTHVRYYVLRQWLVRNTSCKSIFQNTYPPFEFWTLSSTIYLYAVIPIFPPGVHIECRLTHECRRSSVWWWDSCKFSICSENKLGGGIMSIIRTIYWFVSTNYYDCNNVPKQAYGTYPMVFFAALFQ